MQNQCPSCGADAAAEDRFCGECGLELAAAGASGNRLDDIEDASQTIGAPVWNAGQSTGGARARAVRYLLLSLLSLGVGFIAIFALGQTDLLAVAHIMGFDLFQLSWSDAGEPGEWWGFTIIWSLLAASVYTGLACLSSFLAGKLLPRHTPG